MGKPTDQPQPLTADGLLTGACRATPSPPAEAAAAITHGARLVDTRPYFQRAADGEIPGAIIIERDLPFRTPQGQRGSLPSLLERFQHPPLHLGGHMLRLGMPGTLPSSASQVRFFTANHWRTW